MTRLMKSLLTGIVGMGIISASAGAARASIVPTLTTITPLGGSTFRWSYEGNLNPAEKVATGDFFTIYDFTGFVSGSDLEPVGWSFSSSNSGATPAGMLALVNIPNGVTDSPAIPNLTWTYTGTTPIAGPSDLGAFSAVSTYDAHKLSSFSSETTEQSGFTVGSKADNFGPTATPIAPAAVTPEPCTLALLGLGLVPLALRRRKS